MRPSAWATPNDVARAAARCRSRPRRRTRRSSRRARVGIERHGRQSRTALAGARSPTPGSVAATTRRGGHDGRRGTSASDAGSVEILTINRPEARNAINLAVATALSDALDAAEHDDECLVVILTGAEDKAFSAGMDLKAFAQGEAPITENGFAGITKRDFPKPLIAAVNGSALAGGFEIMLSCDLVVAAVAREASASPRPRVASSRAAAGSSGSRSASRERSRSSSRSPRRPIDAERALAVGLVNRVVPASPAARRAPSSSPSRSRGTPRSRSARQQAGDARVARARRGGRLGAQRLVVRRRSRRSHDAMEGAIAFAEKREPNWTGA